MNLLLRYVGHGITISLLVFIMLAFHLSALARTSEKRVLRVAFPQVVGMSWTAEDGSHHGMLVDYLNEIAKYTGWEYEYIDTNRQTVLNEFIAGQYELMGGNYYIPGLEEYYAYPDYNMGYSRSLLLARSDDRTIHSYNLESMNGKTIGVYENAKENIRRLKEFLAINGLDCKFQYYSLKDMQKNDEGLYFYLMNGEIDLLLSGIIYNHDSVRVIATYNSQPYYIVTNPSNKEVLDGLNMALERILDANPNFAAERYAANFPARLVNVQFSDRDLEYVKKRKTITVAVPENWYPFYCKETSQKNHVGIMVDVLDKIKDFTGLDFSYVYAKNYSDAVHLVQRGKADILGFFLGDENDAAQLGLALSASYVSANNIIVRNKACSYPAPGLVGALVESQRFPSGISAEKIRSYPGIKEALAAVNSGEADFIYGLSSKMEQDISRYHFTNLAPVTLVNDQSAISFALPTPVDPDLLTVLNKAINNLSESERTVIRNRNLESIGVNEFSLTDFIYANPLQFMFIVMFVLSVLFTALLLAIGARMKATVIQGNLKRAEAANLAKSEFLSRMSHEIRTPLNAIVGFANILAETKEIEEEEREFYVDIIDKNSELLLQLIEDILDFSKIEAGTFDITKRNFDFKEICEETYAVHALNIPKNVRFVFDRGSQPVTVFSDPKRVVQVISNFLTNAIKFTSEGEIKLAYKVSNDEIRVSVSDTGMGISEEDCRTIFDRFVKLNACKQGTGLGLAICKNIIEKLGGRIGVESTLGVGSTFWFTLPLKEIKENEPKF